LIDLRPIQKLAALHAETVSNRRALVKIGTVSCSADLMCTPLAEFFHATRGCLGRRPTVVGTCFVALGERRGLIVLSARHRSGNELANTTHTETY